MAHNCDYRWSLHIVCPLSLFALVLWQRLCDCATPVYQYVLLYYYVLSQTMGILQIRSFCIANQLYNELNRDIFSGCFTHWSSSEINYLIQFFRKILYGQDLCVLLHLTKVHVEANTFLLLSECFCQSIAQSIDSLRKTSVIKIPIDTNKTILNHKNVFKYYADQHNRIL